MPELKVTAFSATEGVHRRGHADLPLRSLGFFPSRMLFVYREHPNAEIHTLCSVSASGIPKRWRERPRCHGGATVLAFRRWCSG